MKKVTHAKKFILSALAGLGLATIVWNSSMALAAETNYSHKDVNELTEAEKAQLQKGVPTDIKEGEQITFVYQAKGDGKCELAPQPPHPSQPTLPFTGVSNQTLITLGLAVPTLGAAVYLLSKNKKGRQTFMVVVLAGTAVLGTHVISANTVSSLQEQVQALVKQDAAAIAAPQELECFEYVGYLRSGTTTEVPTTETTTTTTTTTPEVPTTVEEPTTTTTTTPAVKKGVYRLKLVFETPDVLTTGDWNSSMTTYGREYFKENNYTWTTIYQPGELDFKILLNGQELKPSKVTPFEDSSREISYSRYEYLLETLSGEVGETVTTTPMKLTYLLKGKEYDSLKDVVDEVNAGVSLFPKDLSEPGYLIDAQSGENNVRNISPYSVTFTEEDQENTLFMNLQIAVGNLL